MTAFGLAGGVAGATGLGAITTAGFGAAGMAVTGFVWMGAGAGTAARAGGGAAAGLGATTVAAGFGGAAAGAGAFTAGPAAGLATGAAAGFALDAGAGPNVMRGRNGSAEIRGNETGRFSGTIAGEILAGFDSRNATAGRSNGRKSATAGSGGSAAVVDSTS